MKIKKSGFIIIVLLLAAFLGLNSMFTVRENEYACTVRFSKIINTTADAGLHFKIPFVDSVKYFPKALRIQIFDSAKIGIFRQNHSVASQFALFL